METHSFQELKKQDGSRTNHEGYLEATAHHPSYHIATSKGRRRASPVEVAKACPRGSLRSKEALLDVGEHHRVRG